MYLFRFKYLSNIIWLFGERLLKIALSFFVGVWLARYLGPFEFGLYNYVISLVGIFTALTTLGLDHILVRELVKSDNWHTLLGTGFVMRLMNSILLFLLFLIFLPRFIDDTGVLGLSYLLAVIWLLQPFNIIDCGFQARVLSRYSVQIRTLALLTSSIWKIVFILIHADLSLFIAVLVFENVVLAVGYVLLSSKISVAISKFRFRFNTAKILLQDSWPLLLSVFAVAVFLKIDQIMIQHYIGAPAVGTYSAAVRISEAVYFIPAVLISTFYPAIIGAKQQNEKLYYCRLQQFYDMMIWAGIGISVIIFIFSQQLVQVLYGNIYSGSAQVLALHIWTVVFVFIAHASSRWFLAENRQKLLMMLNVLAGLLNIVLNLVLIPKLGIKGAAIASLLSYSVASFWGLLLFPLARINFKMFCRSFSLRGVVSRMIN